MRTAVLAALLAFGAPTAAFAQTREAPVEALAAARADVEVMVVHATNDGQVDPRLEKILRPLQSTRFTGFKLLTVEETKLTPGTDTMFTIVGDRRLKVELIELLDTTAKVRIRMFKEGEKVLDTTMTIPQGKYVMLAGPNHKDGKLVIPIGVRF